MNLIIQQCKDMRVCTNGNEIKDFDLDEWNHNDISSLGTTMHFTSNVHRAITQERHNRNSGAQLKI